MPVKITIIMIIIITIDIYLELADHNKYELNWLKLCTMLILSNIDNDN